MVLKGKGCCSFLEWHSICRLLIPQAGQYTSTSTELRGL